MKGKIVAILICMLMLSTIAGAFSTVDTSTEPSDKEVADMPYTHTISSEFFTMTTCEPCKYSHQALKNIYQYHEETLGYHPFYYITMVYDEDWGNMWAKQRKSELGIWASPTIVWDGGYRWDIAPGSDTELCEQKFNTSISMCGSRTVKDIDLSLDIEWLGAVNEIPPDGATEVPIEQIMNWTISAMNIDVGVKNNDANQYNGHIHVHVTEVNSTYWDDKFDNPYTFALLDFAWNKDIALSSGGTWTDSYEWDGVDHSSGYGIDYDEIIQENCMIIAFIFDEDNSDNTDETIGVRAGVNTDPKTFDVYFGNTTPPPLIIENTQNPMYLPHDGLNFTETYYWKVDVWNAKGELDSGTIWTFTTRGNDPPNTPDWPDPANGSTTASIDTNLSWSGGDPDGDETTYDVYFGLVTPEHDPPQVAENHTGTTFDPSPYGDNLDFSTLYEWRIVAWDEYGLNTTGDLWHFRTEANKPPNPAEDPYPEDGAIAVPIDVILHWNGSDPNSGDTLKYDVYFSPYSPPSQKKWNQSENTYDPPYNLTLYNTYYWKIVTWDSMGESAEGFEWAFTTGINHKPTDPIIDGPSSGVPEVDYNFTFVSHDEDGHRIKYYVKWGDGTEVETDFYESDVVVTLNHTWNPPPRTVTIEARAEDEFHEFSEHWTKFDFKLPRNRVYYFNLLEWLFERFPSAFPVLRKLMGL